MNEIITIQAPVWVIIAVIVGVAIMACVGVIRLYVKQKDKIDEEI